MNKMSFGLILRSVFISSLKGLQFYLMRKHKALTMVLEVLTILLVLAKIFINSHVQDTFKEDLLKIVTKQTILSANILNNENVRPEFYQNYFQSINDLIVKQNGIFIARCGQEGTAVTVEFLNDKNKSTSIKEIVNNDMSIDATTIEGKSCERDRLVKSQGLIDKITKDEALQKYLDFSIVIFSILLLSFKIHFHLFEDRFVDSQKNRSKKRSNILQG